MGARHWKPDGPTNFLCVNSRPLETIWRWKYDTELAFMFYFASSFEGNFTSSQLLLLLTGDGGLVNSFNYFGITPIDNAPGVYLKLEVVLAKGSNRRGLKYCSTPSIVTRLRRLLLLLRVFRDFFCISDNFFYGTATCDISELKFDCGKYNGER